MAPHAHSPESDTVILIGIRSENYSFSELDGIEKLKHFFQAQNNR